MLRRRVLRVTTTALVCAGGGVTGIAWEIGVLRGLVAAGGPLAELVTAPGLVVGTSAGSVVGTHVAHGSDLEALHAAQLAPAPAELASDVDLEALFVEFGARVGDATDPLDARRRIGALARDRTDPGVADARRAAIAARLPAHDWPARPLRITAVDVDSGEVEVFHRDSGVALDDAVAASCAVPGVWPVVTIAGRGYTDGGVASLAHATLAVDRGLVVVLAPMPDLGGPGAATLDDEVTALRAGGTEVVVLGPDPDYLAGPGQRSLDPAGRPEAAHLGDAYGRRAATAQVPQ